MIAQGVSEIPGSGSLIGETSPSISASGLWEALGVLCLSGSGLRVQRQEAAPGTRPLLCPSLHALYIAE